MGGRPIVGYTKAGRVPMGWRLRIFAGFTGSGLALLLFVAGFLNPDTRGLGTHEQLGLPPCAWQLMWNIPCPSCGMTTSWSSLVHGDLPGSLRANPAGTSAAFVAALLAVGLIRSAWRNSWSQIVLMPRFWLVIVVLQGLLMLGFWIARVTT